MKNFRIRRLAALAALCIFSSIHAGENQTPGRKILCTTYPIYQLARNITHGSPSVAVDLLLPAAMGCPHDYALTPQDMAKIAEADILIVNGLGMEEFLGKPVERANPDITVIDSSHGIHNVINHEDEHHHDGAEEHGGHHQDQTSHDHQHDDGPNPHLFTSPALSAAMVETIAGRLCLLDPASAAIYAANAAEYAGRLRALAKEMSDAADAFANRRIIEPHGAFEYLARDMGLEIVAHFQPHGQELSASEMLELLDVIREKKPGALVVEPQYPAKAGETLAAETGIPVVRLDSMATGPEDAPLHQYETVMRDNLDQLQKAMGGR